jgi:hypothetical protein
MKVITFENIRTLLLRLKGESFRHELLRLE